MSIIWYGQGIYFFNLIPEISLLQLELAHISSRRTIPDLSQRAKQSDGDILITTIKNTS